MNSRDKGKRGEREWAAFLREHFDCKDARRGVQYSGGTDSPDVVNGIPGTHAEVKRTERLQLHKAMAQAIADAGSGAVPYVASKRNRDDWLVTLRASDLKRLAELLVQKPASST